MYIIIQYCVLKGSDRGVGKLLLPRSLAARWLRCASQKSQQWNVIDGSMFNMTMYITMVLLKYFMDI